MKPGTKEKEDLDKQVNSKSKDMRTDMSEAEKAYDGKKVTSSSVRIGGKLKIKLKSKQCGYLLL